MNAPTPRPSAAGEGAPAGGRARDARRADPAVRASIARTAWILASIALVFFAGVIASKWIGDTSIGMTVVGAAVFLYLVVSIGRHLWRK